MATGTRCRHRHAEPAAQGTRQMTTRLHPACCCALVAPPVQACVTGTLQHLPPFWGRPAGPAGLEQPTSPLDTGAQSTHSSSGQSHRPPTHVPECGSQQAVTGRALRVSSLWIWGAAKPHPRLGSAPYSGNTRGAGDPRCILPSPTLPARAPSMTPSQLGQGRGALQLPNTSGSPVTGHC